MPTDRVSQPRAGARPRILQVLHSFAVGGSEIFGLQLAKDLVEQGAEVLCGAIDSSPGPLLQRCADYGIRAVDLQIPPKSPLGRNGISVALAWRLRGLRLDAVHLQHFLGLNKLGVPARIAGIKRIVVTEHSIYDVAQSRAGRIRARMGWRLASAVTVIHQSIKEYLCRELRLPPDRVEVIPIGIEVEKYTGYDRQACRRKLGIDAQFVFVFVGRLAPVKGVPGLIAAYLAVQARRPSDSSLIIVGDGVDRAACAQLVRSHPLGHRVHLVGEQSDTRPYVGAADVFLMNSRTEGTPRALLEAMAMGLPSICPAVGGIPDITRGRGWLTVPGSQASLEQAIELVLADPQAVHPMAAGCRPYAQAQFDSTRVAQRYKELLIG
jgi:glycosyltransferase involved in cell wall biosynthesis